jgi:hypothetical protein
MNNELIHIGFFQAAAVLEMGKPVVSSRSVHQRIGGQLSRPLARSQLKGEVPTLDLAHVGNLDNPPSFFPPVSTAIRRTIENPEALQEVKFIVRNTAAEDVSFSSFPVFITAIQRTNLFRKCLWILLYPTDHLLLDRSPDIGLLISRWELDKFKNC